MDIHQAGISAIAILAALVVAERDDLPLVALKAQQDARDLVARLEREGHIRFVKEGSLTFSREDVRSWVKPPGST